MKGLGDGKRTECGDEEKSTKVREEQIKEKIRSGKGKDWEEEGRKEKEQNWRVDSRWRLEGFRAEAREGIG